MRLANLLRVLAAPTPKHLQELRSSLSRWFKHVFYSAYTSHQNDSTERSAAPCIPHEGSLIVRRFMFEFLIFHGKYKALLEYIWQNASEAVPLVSIEFNKQPLSAIKTFNGSEERAILLPGLEGLAYCVWKDGQEHKTDVANLLLQSRAAAKVLPANKTKAKKKAEATAKKKKKTAAANPKKGAKAAKKKTAKASESEESESELDSESDTDPDDAQPEEEVPTVAKPPAKATAAVGAAKAKKPRKYWHPRNLKKARERAAAKAAAAGAAAPAAVAPAPAAAASAAAAAFAAAAAPAPATPAQDRDATNM